MNVPMLSALGILTVVPLAGYIVEAQQLITDEIIDNVQTNIQERMNPSPEVQPIEITPDTEEKENST